jgi:hypothetical protein
VQWVTWDQAAVGAVVFLVVFLVLRRVHRPTRLVTFGVALSGELTLVSTLYSIWRIAHRLPFTHEAGAMDRARWLLDVQERLHLPSEIGLQHFVIHHHLAWITNAYYATMHVPSLIVFMIWLFVRHRDHYPHWRNGLALLTLGCLIIRFIRVAPPRFLPELHFVDLSVANGFDVYGPVGTGVSDQFAAMPSIHVGWAAVVALGAVAASRSPWRWVVFLHLPITLFVVAATGHHWWLDGFVAIALLAAGLWLDGAVRRRVARRRQAAELTPAAVG